MGGHYTRSWSEESQMDDAWVRANSERKRGLLLSDASDDASQNDVGRCSLEGTCCSNRRLQRGLLPITFEPRRNREQSLARASSRGGVGTRLHLGSSVSIPRSQGSAKSLGHIQRKRSYELHANGAVTIRRLLVLSFRTKSRTSLGESRKTH